MHFIIIFIKEEGFRPLRSRISFFFFPLSSGCYPLHENLNKNNNNSELGQCSAGEDVRHKVAKLRETFLAEGREAEIALRKAEEVARNDPTGYNISAAQAPSPIQIAEAHLLEALDEESDTSSDSS